MSIFLTNPQNRLFTANSTPMCSATAEVAAAEALSYCTIRLQWHIRYLYTSPYHHAICAFWTKEVQSLPAMHLCIRSNVRRPQCNYWVTIRTAIVRSGRQSRTASCICMSLKTAFETLGILDETTLFTRCTRDIAQIACTQDSGKVNLYTNTLYTACSLNLIAI